MSDMVNKKHIRILNPMKAVFHYGNVRVDTNIEEHELADNVIKYLEQIGFKIEILDK